MNRIPPFSSEQLTALCKVIGDTDSGLTGAEIGHVLGDIRVPDIDAANTKWKRLFSALAEFQNERGFGNHIVVLINKVMDPARYTRRPEEFHERRAELNPILALSGMTVGADGKMRNAPRAAGIDEAVQRAGRLRQALLTRQVHQDVLGFCKAELLQQNYFHAVFEAMKSIAAKTRQLSGLTSDGSQLVTDAFALGRDCQPLLAINPLVSETDKGEQRGFVNLLVGLFGTIRNPTAHNPKVEWPMPEQDALDILSMVSLVHRKLDKAYRYRGSNSGASSP